MRMLPGRLEHLFYYMDKGLVVFRLSLPLSF